MPDRIFELVQGASAVREGLNFQAHGVRVDNWTNQPIRVRGSSVYCPPNVIGWSAPMPGTALAEAEFIAPPGVPFAPVGKVPQTAQVIFSSEPQPFSMGMVIAAQGPSTQRLLADVTVAPSTTVNKAVVLDDSVQAIIIDVISGLANIGAGSVVTDNDNARTLATIAQTNGSQVAPVESGATKNLTITIITTGGGSAHVAVYESFLPLAATVTTLGTPIVDVTDRVARLLGEVSTRPQMPDGQANAEPAANAVATATIAASTGRRHTLQSFDMSFGANAATAVVVTPQILDGATAILSDILGTPAGIGNTSRVTMEAGALKIGTVSTSMSAQTPAGGANMFSRASLSTYTGIQFGTPL